MKFFKIFTLFILFGLITIFINVLFNLTIDLSILVIISLILSYLIFNMLKKTDKSLQEKELFITGPIVVFKWSGSEHLKVEYVSENVENIFECSAKEFISGSESYLNYIHHEDIYRVLNELNLYSASGVGEFVHTPYRVITKTGKVKWVYVSIKIIRDKNENIINYFGYIIDVTKQKENENKLKKISKTLEYTGDSVVMTDVDGVITYVNPAFERLTLYGRDEVLGLKSSIKKSGNHSKEFYEKLWNTILNGEIFRDIFINKKKNGEIFYEEQTIAPIKDDKGVITSFVSTGKDITNRMLREKELEDIFNLSVNPIAITDLETNFLRVNSAYERMSGYTKDELMFLSCVALSKKSEITAVKKALKSAIKNGFLYDMKKTCVSKDGSEVPINLSISLLPNKKELLLIATDISKEVNLQEILKHKVEVEVNRRMENEQKYQYLFNSGNDAIFIHHFDKDGLPDKFLEVNDVACKMFGYSKDEFLNLKPQDIAKSYTEEPIEKLKQRKENIFERKYITKDGKIIIGEVNAKVFMLDNKPTIFGAIRDITKRKEQERILIQQSKMAAMGEMIGNIAHQWRQPLNVIGLILQKIKLANARGKLTSELIDESNEKAMNLINKLSFTIDNFRDFFKPKEREELFSISDSIESALKIIGDNLKNHNIEIKLNLKDEIQLIGFSNEFSQVIINLLSNSKDAILSKKDRGFISINTYIDKMQGVIEFIDDGGGVKEEFIDKIFEPYFTSKEASGTGIGLYMSKMIIEDKMKGKLKAENLIKNNKIVGLKISIRIYLYN